VLSVAYPLAIVGLNEAGGSEQILAQLDRGLVEHGHRSFVVACEDSKVRGTLIPVPRPKGTFIPEARVAAQEWVRDAIRRAMDRYSFDVVHMHALEFYEYLPPEGVPVLVTLHLPVNWYPPEIFRITRPDTWLQCVSPSQERTCPLTSMLLPPKVLPWIGNGIDIRNFSPCESKDGYALALGRICPEKGFHLAIDAAREAGVRLVIAGKVFPYPAHEEYFQKELQPRIDGETVHFVGPIFGERKRQLLAEASCLLTPSLVPETGSLVSMEAFACGTAVIAFPSGALADVVEHGRTGFLVNDAAEMAAAIGRAREISPADCLRAARVRFSAERMIAEYLARYEQLAHAAARDAHAAA
jgi:glycosyltransferase involved in cell wall biosynthesis